MISTERTPVTIHLTVCEGCKPFTREGFVVPDTASTFAVDERDTREWVITHLPTGRKMSSDATRRLTSCVTAIAVAQALYREFTALGADMTSADATAIATFLNSLSKDDVNAFWSRVLA